MIKVLKDFGFSSLSITAEDFQKEYAIIQLGYPPYRIDILTTPDGVDFDECFSRRIQKEIGNGVFVNFVDLANLIKMKKAAGRTKDLLDIENLE